MRTLKEALENNIHGLHYGNRLLLPFPVDILKIAVENDLITDFSSKQTGAEYNVHERFTEVYFHDYKSLEDIVSKYEIIKMVVVERGKDIFNFNEHKIISVDILEKHKAEIKELDEDTIFIN